jgi:hypothetical protein
MKPKTTKTLAQEAGYPIRKFYRLLAKKDQRACAILRAELTWQWRIRLEHFKDNSVTLARVFDKVDPAFAAHVKVMAGLVETLFQDAKGVSRRPLTDWQTGDPLEGIDWDLFFTKRTSVRGRMRSCV